MAEKIKHKLELTLVTPVNKCQFNLDDILSQIDIDKSDIFWNCPDSDQIKQIAIIFDSKDNAEKLRDYLLIDENMQRYNFGNLKMSQANEIEKNRRFSISSSDSFQMINEDRNENFIESIAGEGCSFQCFDENESTTTSYTHANNNVEFYFDKEIRDQDLDIILLYLENMRMSGGGEYLSNKIDSKKRLLNLEYKSQMNKSKVLDKKFLKIKLGSIEYNITANEPLDIDSFQPNRSVIILRNIPDYWFREEIVNIYAENLVLNDDETNELIAIKQSLIFPMTVYAKYKHDFDLELLKKRYEKKNTINDNKIEYLEAFKSKIVLVRLYDKNMKAVSKDLIEIYFTNKPRCGSESFLSIHEREPFLLLSYGSQEICEAICSRNHKIGQHELVVECLYNFELFEKIVKELSYKKMDPKPDTTQQVHEPKSEKNDQVVESKKTEKKIPPEPIIDKITEVEFKKSDETKEESPKTNVEKKIEFKKSDETKEESPKTNVAKKIEFRKPFFKIDSSIEPKVMLLKTLDNSIENNLIEKLSDRQSSLKFNYIADKLELLCECTHDLPSNINEYKEMKRKWENDIENLIKSFFEQFEIKNLLIKYPEIVEAKLNFDKLKVNLIKKDNREQNSIFEIVGFADEVERLNENIQKLDVFKPEEPVGDEISGLTLQQIRTLFVVKYIRQIKQKFPSMNVTINHQLLKVFFKGKPSEIKVAKEICTEILDKIRKKDLPMEKYKTIFLNKREISMVNWLKDNDFECVLMANIDKNFVSIYYTDLDKAQKCIEKLKTDIISREISKELSEGIDSSYIKKFIENYSKSDQVNIEESNGIIYISGFKKNVEDVFQEFFENIID